MQTSLGRARYRQWGPNAMLEHAREEILTTPEGVRLQCFVSTLKDGARRGSAILLPGWESSAHTTYVVCLGRKLFQKGFDVYRLNFRDHGGTHHLNEGMFHGALLQEVADAVSMIGANADGKPVYLIGFSMGGNFALRLACLELPFLNTIYAVSPVLKPLASTRKMDENPLTRAYFREKWLRSLKRKEALFPQRYDFEELYQESDILKMTGMILSKYTDFPSVEAYFDQYTLTPERLEEVRIPAYVNVSEDDPVLADSPYTEYLSLERVWFSVQKFGGHIGFIRPNLRVSWVDRIITRRMLESVNEASG
ncbi:MAG: alpha/beta fold hydrolase [Fidelibacterota bacterium]|nr:MAG: alpha/beta fold hydrolase [Candidatus Neomarinimicrobiota bacterium]